MNANLQRAWKLFEIGRYRESVAEFELAKARPEDVLSASVGAALAYHNLGDFEEAKEHARKLLALNPEQVDAHAILGRTLRLQGKPAEAEPYLREALRLSPDLAGNYGQLALVLLDDGRPAEAETLAREGLACDPGDLECRNALIQTLISLGRHGDARRFAAENVATYPDAAHSHKLAAMAAMAGEDFSSARTHAREALRLNPSDSKTESIYISALRKTSPVNRLIRRAGRVANILPVLSRLKGTWIADWFIVFCCVLWLVFGSVFEVLISVLFCLRKHTRVSLSAAEVRSLPWSIVGIACATAAFVLFFRSDRGDFFKSGLTVVLLLKPVREFFEAVENRTSGWFLWLMPVFGITAVVTVPLQFFIPKTTADTCVSFMLFGAVALHLISWDPNLTEPPGNERPEDGQHGSTPS